MSFDYNLTLRTTKTHVECKIRGNEGLAPSFKDVLEIFFSIFFETEKNVGRKKILAVEPHGVIISKRRALKINSK